jgi:hypothetical protein
MALGDAVAVAPKPMRKTLTSFNHTRIESNDRKGTLEGLSEINSIRRAPRGRHAEGVCSGGSIGRVDASPQEVEDALIIWY